MADPATFIATWLTPSSLFILVNLVIGTIAITSRLTASPNNENRLVRSPSLLDRVKSFNLRRHYQSQPESEPEPEPESEPTQPQLVRKPSLLDRVSSFKLDFYKNQPSLPESEFAHPQPQLVRTPSLLQRVRSMNFSRIYRSESMHHEHEDSNPTPKPGFEENDKAEMKKPAASERECESEEAVERRRPATAMGRVETTTNGEDEEVDLKADDFINRFKKQLKLQRLESLIRYRDTMASHGRY